MKQVCAVEKALAWELGQQSLTAALSFVKLWHLRRDISPPRNLPEHFHGMLYLHQPFNPHHQCSTLLAKGTLQMEKLRHRAECTQAHKLLSGNANM